MIIAQSICYRSSSSSVQGDRTRGYRSVQKTLNPTLAVTWNLHTQSRQMLPMPMPMPFLRAGRHRHEPETESCGKGPPDILKGAGWTWDSGRICRLGLGKLQVAQARVLTRDP